MSNEKQPSGAKDPELKPNEVLKLVSDSFVSNFPTIVDKTSRMAAALTALKDIKDDKADEWAEKALVKGRNITAEVDLLRKDITKPLDNLKSALMAPEKLLEKELERVRSLRNAYANDKNKAAVEAQAKIDKELIYKTHESEVKQEMKANIQFGIAKKVTDLEKTISGLFAKMSLDPAAGGAYYKNIAKALDFKPVLKPEFVNSLIEAPYNSKIMTKEQYEGIVERARSFPLWSYENLNAEYMQQALRVAATWRDQLMPRVRELEKIAAGGPEAEKVKARLDETIAAQAETVRQNEKVSLDKIEEEKQSAIQEETLSAEFSAQIQSQNIEEVGGRKKRTYRIDPAVERDFLKVSNIIGKMALNILTEETRKSIFKLDASGFPKRDDKGDPIYIDGVSFWLKELASLPYNPKIEGLVMTEEIVTAARK
jgi:hypothetical protein